MGTTRKINCKTFLDDVSNFLDGELDAELRISIEAHLAKCPDCWLIFDETKKTVAISRGVDCHPLPEEVEQRLMKTLEQHLNRS